MCRVWTNAHRRSIAYGEGGRNGSPWHPTHHLPLLLTKTQNRNRLAHRRSATSRATISIMKGLGHGRSLLAQNEANHVVETSRLRSPAPTGVLSAIADNSNHFVVIGTIAAFPLPSSTCLLLLGKVSHEFLHRDPHLENSVCGIESPANGRWRHRSAVELRRFGSPLGSL